RLRGAELFSLSRGSSELKFRFVGDTERWVSEAVLAGQYEDVQGNQYVFGTNGEASFPGDRRFRYTLATHHVLNPYDYIYSANLKATWAVEISRKNLLIFEVECDHDEIVTATPKWSLVRLTAPSCK